MRDWENYKFWLNGNIYGRFLAGQTASLIDLALGHRLSPRHFARFYGHKALTEVWVPGSWRAAEKAIARP